MNAQDRILVRGVNWLGDAVMTTPALQRLREARPGAHITLLTHIKLAGLWEQHPAIDSVLTFSDDDSVFAVAKKLRAGKFSHALVLPNSPRSALEVFFAGIPFRVGAAGSWRTHLLTVAVPPHPGIHKMRKRPVGEIRRLAKMDDDMPGRLRNGPGDFDSTTHQLHHYLQLVSPFGGNPSPLPPKLRVTDTEVAAVQQRFGFNSASGGTLLGINAGAEYGPAKRWPKERFIEAAVELQRRTGCHWWIFGGKADVELAAGIANGIADAKAGPPEAVRSIAGQTSLRELCAALKACRLLISNDTGPMHVAAAVGTSVVVPFGSTSPELTGPGQPGDPRHRLIKSAAPCSPCFLRECPIDFRCMNGIETTAVVQHAMELLTADVRGAE